MKALVYGKEDLIDRISSNLARLDIETMCVNDRETLCLDYCDTPSIVVLDGMANDVKGVSDSIHRIWDVCTVLVCHHGEHSWREFETCTPDGYITGQLNNNEFLARFITIYRRYIRVTSNDRGLIDELTAYYRRIQPVC